MEGGLALMEDRMREPVAGLELDHMLVLCSSWALRTHIVMDLDPCKHGGGLGTIRGRVGRSRHNLVGGR